MNLNDLKKVSKFCAETIVPIVGIGTISPGEKLTIGNGAFNFHDGGNKVLAFSSDFDIGGWDRQGGASYQAGIEFNPTLGDLGIGISGADNSDYMTSSNRLLIKANGNVGIGTTAPSAQLDIRQNLESNTGSLLNGVLTVNPPSGSTTNTWGTYMGASYSNNSLNMTAGGVRGAEFVGQNSSTATIVNAYGVVGVGSNSSSGNVTNSFGTIGSSRNSSTGTTTNAYGGFFETVNSGGGTLTNGYGVFVAAVDAVNKWAVYTSGTTPSYFGGNVGVGTINPGRKLAVAGDANGVDGNFNGGQPLLRLQGTTAMFSEPALEFVEQSNAAIAMIAAKNTGNGAGDLHLLTRQHPAAAPTSKVVVKDSGNVGIGTAAPSERLDVGGGNVKMGWERLTSAIINPGTSLNLSCSAGKYVMGWSCIDTANGDLSPASSYPNADNQVTCRCPPAYNSCRIYMTCSNMR